MKPLKNTFVVLACASLLFGQSACQTTTNLLSSTQFSQSAYNTDKKIKADSLALIARAKDRAPYTSVAADVDQLMKKIDQAISREQARTKNAPTVEQWKKIRTHVSHFFDLWKTKGTLSPAFVVDEKRQTSDLFDIIIRTEDAKRPRS
jgi:ribosome-associated translation inhibitor RaiA